MFSLYLQSSSVEEEAPPEPVCSRNAENIDGNAGVLCANCCKEILSTGKPNGEIKREGRLSII